MYKLFALSFPHLHYIKVHKYFNLFCVLDKIRQYFASQGCSQRLSRQCAYLSLSYVVLLDQEAIFLFYNYWMVRVAGNIYISFACQCWCSYILCFIRSVQSINYILENLKDTFIYKWSWNLCFGYITQKSPFSTFDWC